MPVEQITTYFQAASTACLVRRCPTRNAVTIVVASIATQTTPRLAASTAAAIAARKSCTSDASAGRGPGAGAPGGDLGVQPGRGRGGGQQADRADHDQHELASASRPGPGRQARSPARDLTATRQRDRRGQQSAAQRRRHPGGERPPQARPQGSEQEAGGPEQRHDDGGEQQRVESCHQSCSSRSSSRSVSPKASRIRLVSTCSTSDGEQHVEGDAELDDQAVPAVARKPTAVMPLSISRNPTSCDSARRRVTSTKKPDQHDRDSPTGIACAAGDRASSATSGRDDRVGEQRQHGGGQQRGGDVHQGTGLARRPAAAVGLGPARARRSSRGSATTRSASDPGGDRAEARVMACRRRGCAAIAARASALHA